MNVSIVMTNELTPHSRMRQSLAETGGLKKSWRNKKIKKETYAVEPTIDAHKTTQGSKCNALKKHTA
jgi:hypothetical protein